MQSRYSRRLPGFTLVEMLVGHRHSGRFALTGGAGGPRGRAADSSAVPGRAGDRE